MKKTTRYLRLKFKMGDVVLLDPVPWREGEEAELAASTRSNVTAAVAAKVK